MRFARFSFDLPAPPEPPKPVETTISGPLRRRGRPRWRKPPPSAEDPDNGWRKERAQRLMCHFDKLGAPVRETLARSRFDIDDKFLRQLPEADPADDGRIVSIVRTHCPEGI